VEWSGEANRSPKRTRRGGGWKIVGSNLTGGGVFCVGERGTWRFGDGIISEREGGRRGLFFEKKGGYSHSPLFLTRKKGGY